MPRLNYVPRVRLSAVLSKAEVSVVDSLCIDAPILFWRLWSLFCNATLSNLFSFAIISLRKSELKRDGYFMCNRCRVAVSIRHLLGWLWHFLVILTCF